MKTHFLILLKLSKTTLANLNVLNTFLLRIVLICLLSYCFSIVAKADVNLIVGQDIAFANKKGTFGGKMSYKDQAWEAIGSFQVNSQNKVRFQINQLNVGGRFYNLKQKPLIVRQLKSPNAILRKGSNLILKNENQAEFDEFYSAVNDTALTKQDEKEKQKRKARTLNRSGSSRGGDSSESSSGISIGSSSGSSNMPYYIPSITGTTTDTGDGKTTTYTTQFCKTPEYLTNAIKLSIVDKDGNCIERLAVRDDTKCEYRFDFANNKAIKQTQFYYVDNENKVQVVGDCVDLQGEQYQATLYKDDTRCELETTNKDYGGGKASFFVTQILFRGIDGLIHNATDCIAYGNIKEELVQYEHNEKSKQSQRVVNQYYTDYYTGEKVYLTQGVRTSNVYDWKETTCGEWEHDDENLKSTLRTEITFYDDVDYKKVNITVCDYSTLKGKAAKYEVEYVRILSTDRKVKISQERKNFYIPKWLNNHNSSCKSRSGGRIDKIGWKLNYVTNWYVDYVTYDITPLNKYMRVDGTFFYEGEKDIKEKNRITDIIRENFTFTTNQIGLSNDWALFYEIHTGTYKINDSQTAKTISDTQNYKNWVATKTKGTTCVYGKEAWTSCTGHNIRHGDNGYCISTIQYMTP